MKITGAFGGINFETSVIVSGSLTTLNIDDKMEGTTKSIVMDPHEVLALATSLLDALNTIGIKA